MFNRFKPAVLLGAAMLLASPVFASIPRDPFNLQPHRAQTDHPEKNRVGGSRVEVIIGTGFSPVQNPETQQVEWVPVVRCASGRLYFISADPMGIDGGANLFAYGNLNPVNFVDPSGLNVAYLNDSEGAGGAGHAAGAVGNDDSGWTYYSFAANNPFTSSDNLTVQTYDTYADMMNANPRYENSNVYPTDAASDAAANRAGNLYNGAPYDLLIQNCDDVASRILRDAGVNVNHSLTPNGTFKNQAAGCNK